MKQTAVEWLMQQLKNIDITHKEVFEQAKAMEKGQIIEAHSNGWNKGIQNNFISSQEYYNETYESKTNL